MKSTDKKFSPYKIGLDARPLSMGVTGISRLIAEILRYFPEKEKFQFILFSHLPLHKAYKFFQEEKNVTVYHAKGVLAKKGGIFFNFQLPFIIRKLKLDLFWGSQQVLPPFLPKDLPCVLTYCDLVLYLYPNTMRRIAALQQKLFQKNSVKRANHILCISEQTRLDLIKKFKIDEKRTGISYPGVDPNRNAQLLKEKPSETINELKKEPFLFSVSTLEPRKNYPFLLDVFSIYRKISKQKNLKWVIAGKIGWEKSEFLEELYYQIEKYKDIVLLNNIDDVDLHHLYSSCSIFLFASYYEGFGIPLLEALSHFKPCVVSNIPTFKEIGEDKIIYLPIGEPKKWAEEIIMLQNLNKKVTIDIRKFSWENTALVTKQAFENYL